MKLLLIVTTALVLSATLGCAASPAPVASSRNAYLAERETMGLYNAVPYGCGQKDGRCTVLFHGSPKTRPAANVEATIFPLELPKPEHLSKLDE